MWNVGVSSNPPHCLPGASRDHETGVASNHQCLGAPSPNIHSCAGHRDHSFVILVGSSQTYLGPLHTSPISGALGCVACGNDPARRRGHAAQPGSARKIGAAGQHRPQEPLGPCRPWSRLPHPPRHPKRLSRLPAHATYLGRHQGPRLGERASAPLVPPAWPRPGWQDRSSWGHLC